MRRTARAVLLVWALGSLVVLPGLPALAATGSWSTPVTLSEAGHSAGQQRVATDGSIITAVWSRYDGTSDRIQTSSSTNGGLVWSDPVTLSEPGQLALNPQVVIGGGAITAAWTIFDGTFYRTEVSSSTDAGANWSVPTVLSTAGVDALWPGLTAAGGAIIASWAELGGGFDEVKIASSTDAGTTWTAGTPVSVPGEFVNRPELVTDGTTMTVIWRAFDGVNPRLIRTASSTTGGLSWSTPRTLSAVGEDATQPQLVTDSATITAIWSASDGSNYRVQSASSVDGGATWSTPTPLSASGVDSSDPQLVTNGTTITAGWATTDGGLSRVWAAASTDRGATWSTPVAVSPTGEDASQPKLVTNGYTVIASWNGSDGSNYKVQSAASVDGGLTWSAPAILSEAGQNAFSPELTTDGTTVIAAWFRSDGSDNRVQASSLRLERPTQPQLASTGADRALTLGVAALIVGLGGALILLGRARAAASRGYRA